MNEPPKRYYCCHVQNAAAELLQTGDIYISQNHPNDGDGGWIDCYSHEPFIRQSIKVKRVLASLSRLHHEISYKFEVRLFCPDGYMTITALGVVTEQAVFREESNGA